MQLGGDSMIENLMRDHLKDFKNYVIPENNYKYVLNANESPFNLFEDPDLKCKLLEAIKEYKTNIYPDGSSSILRSALSEYLKLGSDQIICANGSDELIPMIFTAFLNPGEAVVSHYPSFDMYKISAQIAQGNFIGVEDLESHKIDVEGIISAAKKNNAKLIFLCVPNNPTGHSIDKKDIIRIIEHSPGIVILDEAYVEFSDANCIDLIEKYENLIVLRTFSKAFGMAGLRVGYALGQKKMINILNKVKQPYNLNSMSQLIASWAIENRAPIIEKIKYLSNERDYLYEKLKGIPGITVYESQSNFILIKVADGEKVNSAMLKNSVLLKYFDKKPMLENCFRITVTTRETNDLILEILKGVLEDA
jgi:histidinol-phosphate aminotransferase